MTALRRQDGFTLVELLVAMAMSLIVFSATLTILDSYLRQSAAATKRFDAQDQARLAVDRIVRDLRNVSSPLTTPKLLERATPYDVVFQTIGTPSGANVSGIQRVRYCIPQDTSTGSASQERLIAQTQTWTTSTPTANPWTSDPSQTIACPDLTFAPAAGQPVYTVFAQVGHEPLSADLRVSGLQLQQRARRQQRCSDRPAPGLDDPGQPARQPDARA